MKSLEEKILNHPRSQVAKAFRLGQASANGMLPWVKLLIRYYLLKDRGMFRSKRQDREYTTVREKLFELTKTK